MKTIGITGGTGLVGTQVAALLVGKGYEVILFTRSTAGRNARPGCTYAEWDPARKKCDVAALKRTDAIVHLAGENVAGKRWTTEQKKKIVGSRVQGTQFLVSQLKEHAPNCKTLVAASATGFYGADSVPAVPFTESAQPASDFLGSTCRQWEAEEQKATSQMRTVIVRIGIVLAPTEGAFNEFAKPLAFGLKPILGSGKQVISWIHVADLAGLIVYALEQKDMHGIYNAVAPAPVTNREMMDTIAKVKGGFYITAPAPAFALRIALGELSGEVLKSATVSAAKTLGAGFIFQYPEIEGAVQDLLGK
jgi:uncharacterized protein (TIGR01777 family)